MLERMERRVRRDVEARCARRRGEIAERLRQELPAGISVAVEGGAIGLAGRRLKRRAALDPELRGLLGRLV